jgi:hypothetical protein
MSVFMQPIYTQTISGSSTAVVTFNNIPQGFTDLVIKASARANFNALWHSVNITFNGNTSTTSYSNTFAYGFNNTTASAALTIQGNNPSSIYSAGTQITANTFSNCEMYIPNYTSASFKESISESVVENNSSTNYLVLIDAATYRNTAPITSITLTSNELANYVAGTTFTLYGISEKYDTAQPIAPTIGTVTDQAGFASVAFTPASNDRADSYVVTSTPSGSTTYGISSPISTPAVLDTSYTYQVASVNSLGSSASSASSALTSYNSWASIASFAVTSSTASLTFANIPQNYKHLVLHITGMSANTSGVQVDMGFNGDGAQLYTFHQFYGSNATASSGSSAPRNDIPEVAIIRPNNQIKPGVSELFIYDYNDTTKFKVCHWYLGNENQATGYIQQATGMWRRIDPVTAINLTGRGASFGANSHVALYGIA